MEKSRLKAFIKKLPKGVIYAFIGLFYGAIKSVRPVIATGLRLVIGLLSFGIGAIIAQISKQSKSPEQQKLRQMEKFFMSSFRNNKTDNRNIAARERFENELRNIKEIERQKKRRFNRIDGAWKIASVGSGLLTGGFLLDVNFFAGVGLGLLVGGAVGWVGAIINNFIYKNTESKNAIKVPPRELIEAPQLTAPDLPSGRSELVQKILLEAATSLQKLDTIIPTLRHPDSISSVTQLVRTGKRIMDNIAQNPEKLSIAQRVFTYYCPEAYGVAAALAKIENDNKPDVNRILSTQGILQKLVVLFEKTELELKADDNKSLDIDLKLLDQSLQMDLKNN